MSRKLLLEDAHGQREFLLVGTLTVGRDPRCEISANDPLLSRQHAEFVETASGVLVRDLHSQNGIRVNDVAVKEAALRSGDIVQIARMHLRYLEEASTQPGAPAGMGASTEDEDKTRVLKSPHGPAGAQAAERSAAVAAADASISGAAAAGTPAAGGAGAPGSGMAATMDDDAARAARDVVQVFDDAADASSAGRAAGPADAEADDDRTRVVPAPPAAMRGARAAPRRADAGAHDIAAAPGMAAAGTSPSAGGAASRPASAQGPAAAAGEPAGRRAAAPLNAPAAGARSAAASGVASQDAVNAEHPAKAAVRAPRGTWGGRVLLRILLLGLLCSLASAVPLMVWHQQQVRAVALSRATTLANWFAAEAALALERGQDAGPAVDAISAEAGIVAARVLSPEGHVTAPAARAAEVVSVFPGVGAAPADVLRQQSGWNGDLLEVVQPIATSRGPRTALAWITLNPTTEFGGSSLVIVAPAVVAAIFLAWIVAMLITRPTLRALGQLNEDVELALSGRLDAVTDPLGAKPVKELADTISYLAARIRTSGLDVALERGRRGPFIAGDTGQQSALGAAASVGARAGIGARAAAGVNAQASAKAHADAAAPGAAGAAGSHASAAAGMPAGGASAASAAAADGTNVPAGPASVPGAAARAASPAASGASAASAASAAAARPAASGSGARAASDAANASAPAGILIVDTAFRVTHADPLCATMLGARADALVGRHLLDAITDRLIVDAVLGCLSALPASGEREATATDGSGRTIAVNVGRTAKDQPVTVTLRALEARDA